MFDVDNYMLEDKPAHYDIDNDISVEITTYGNSCYVSIYNDRNNKSVAFQVTKNKVKGLADFLNRNLGYN